MRPSRSRKTADKMAAYKVAASKHNARQPPSDSQKKVPIRVSPRRKKNGVQNNVHISHVAIVPERKKGGQDALSTSVNVVHDEGGSTSSKDMKASPEASVNNFDLLEEIPETPPRIVPDSQCVGRKRGTQLRPLGSKLHSESDLESDNESEKPSKKRKTFTTPPRGSDQAKGNSVPSDASPVTSAITEDENRQNSSPRSDSMVQASVRIAPVIRGRRLLSSAQKSTRGIRSRSYDQVDHDVNGDNLNLLSVSSVTISRLFDTFGKKLLTQVSEMQKENVAEVRKIADSVLNTVSTEVRHIEGVVSMLTRGMNGARNVRSNARTTLTEWEQKLNALTPDTDVIFNKEVFAILLCYNSPNQAVKIYGKGGSSDIERAVLSAQTLLFSLQPGDKKYSYTGKIGTMHSDFKFVVVQNAFFNVIRDTFKMFSSPKEGMPGKDSSPSDSALSNGTGKSGEHSAMGAKQIRKPAWLDSKVSKDHINDARNFLERPNQSRKNKIRRTPSPYDIACHGALRVYRLLGNYLHLRRGAVRSTFFQNLGYLLVPWSDHVTDIKQSSLKMSWHADVHQDSEHLSLDLDDIPLSEQCGFVLNEGTITSADAKNKKTLRQLFSEWPEMVLSVEHTVCVVDGNGGQRKHSGGEFATMSRLFNMIDVACDVCVDYCGVGTRENFLRGHKYSFQCVMILALLFKAFCDDFMRKANLNSSAAVTDSERHSFPKPVDLELHGFSLKELVPGPSTQKNLLECRCLRLTRSEYNMYNHRDDEENGMDESAPGGSNVIDMIDIQESEELGIGVL